MILMCDVVPGPPENLTVQVLNFAVTLSWQPPLLTNGIIIFYTVTYNGSKNEAQPVSYMRSCICKNIISLLG